jgi:hypothetical protein
MEPTFDQLLTEILTVAVTLGIGACALALLLNRLKSTRADLAIGKPMAAALAVRVISAIAVSLTGAGASLRGGDELSFLLGANLLADSPFGSAQWVDALTGELHVFVIAVQEVALDSPDIALRVTEASIAVAGLAMLSTAVFELGGRRAATISAWFLAFEPAGVFFSTLIHREALLFLALGMVSLGAAMMWRHSELRSLPLMAVGCALAAATRPYVGWFLIAAGAATTMHTALRGALVGSARGLAAVAALVLAVAIAAPFVLGDFASQSLNRLEVSQEANAADDSNLRLEEVDFSSVSGVLTGLPVRIRDLSVRPYPWELENTSQRLGLLGTLFALGLLYLLVSELVRKRGQIMARAGPLVYIGVALLIAYALAVGNAGTGYRYRTQIIALGICAVSTLALAPTRRRESPIKRRTPALRPAPVLQRPD